MVTALRWLVNCQNLDECMLMHKCDVSGLTRCVKQNYWRVVCAAKRHQSNPATGKFAVRHDARLTPEMVVTTA